MKIEYCFSSLMISVFSIAVLSSCLDEKANIADSDVQIVVIGNGAERKIDWTRALVVDVAKESTLHIQSFIAEENNLVPVQERFKDLTPLKGAASNSVRLDWIAQGIEESTALIKLSSSKNVEPASQSLSYQVESNEECSVVEASPSGANCRNDLVKFEISNEQTPVISEKGQLVFVDKKNNLWISWRSDLSAPIAEAIKNFIYDQNLGLFFRTADNSWFFYSSKDLGQKLMGAQVPAKKLSSDGILYSFESNFYLISSDPVRFAGASKKTFELRKFNSQTTEFELVKQAPANFDILSLGESLGMGVQHDKLFVFANISSSTLGVRKALIQISPEGNIEIPMKGSQFRDNRLFVGNNLLWIAEKDDAHKQLAGEVCSEEQSADQSRKGFQCKSLFVPESVRVVASALEDDLLVLGLEKDIAPQSQTYVNPLKGSDHEVVVVESQLSKPEFGTIIKSWSAEEVVKDIRFFALNSSESKTANPQSQPSPDLAEKSLSSKIDH